MRIITKTTYIHWVHSVHSLEANILLHRHQVQLSWQYSGFQNKGLLVTAKMQPPRKLQMYCHTVFQLGQEELRPWLHLK